MDGRERVVGELRATLGTSGWTRVIDPMIKTEILQTLDNVATPGKKIPEGWTKEEFNAFLSGRVDGLKFVLSKFKSQIEEFEQQRLSDQMLQSQPSDPVGSPYSEAANPTQEG